MMNVPTEVQQWSDKENLCLVSCVLRFGLENWNIIKEIMISFCGKENDSEKYKTENLKLKYDEILHNNQNYSSNRNILEKVQHKLKNNRIEEIIQEINQKSKQIAILDNISNELEEKGSSNILKDSKFDLSSETFISDIFEKAKPKIIEETVESTSKPFQIKIEDRSKKISFLRHPRLIRLPFVLRSLEEKIEKSNIGKQFSFSYPTEPLNAIKQKPKNIIKNTKKRSKSLKSLPTKKTKYSVITETSIAYFDEFDFLKVVDAGGSDESMEKVVSTTGKDDEYPNDVLMSTNSTSSNISNISVTSTLAEERIWRRTVVYLLENISSYKCAFAFLSPVSDRLVKYFKIIKRPRDIRTLTREIENGMIKEFKIVHRDLMIMFQNALMYNKSDSSVYLSAYFMLKDAHNKIMQFKENFEKVETD